MNETMLTLKSGVTLTEQDGQVGLTLIGRTQFAKDEQQIEILRALVRQSQPMEELLNRLHAGNDPPQDDNDAALTIASFILDFGEYLKS